MSIQLPNFPMRRKELHDSATAPVLTKGGEPELPLAINDTIPEKVRKLLCISSSAEPLRRR